MPNTRDIDHELFNNFMEENRKKRVPTIGQRVLVTGGSWAGFSGEYAGEETTNVGVLQRVDLDNGMSTLVSLCEIRKLEE